MKKPAIWATFAAGLFCLSAAQPAHGQGEVAIIDLKYIFENSNKFKALSEDMRGRVQAAENDIKARREQVNNLVKQLQGYKPGSAEYKQLEEDITRRKGDLSAQVELQKKNFIREEAKIYYTVYQEVAQEVEYFAKTNQKQLVIRFNGDPVDQHDPNRIAQQLNKPVVYYDPKIDITPIILDVLNRRFPGGTDNNARNPRPSVPRR